MNQTGMTKASLPIVAPKTPPGVDHRTPSSNGCQNHRDVIIPTGSFGRLNQVFCFAVNIDIGTEDAPGDLYALAELTGFFSGIIWYPWGVHLDLHPNDRVVRGYSLGPMEHHLIRLGNRDGLPVETVYAWNCDYTIEKPDYILDAEQRMLP